MDRGGPRPDSGGPYRVLGVSAGASQQDIARAYRQAAHGAHPDARPGDPAAGRRGRGTAAAEFDDPVVILGPRPGQGWGWP